LASDRKSTVLQMLPALNAGGVERGTLEVAQHLVKNGHRSLVMSAGGRMVEQLEREGSEHFSWPVGRKSLWTLGLIWKLRRFLIEQNVDILHVRSRLPAWVAYLAWKGMDPATRPHFVTTVHGMYSVSRYSAVMMKGERVIAVSDTIRRYILKHYPAVAPERVRVIPRGVDPAEFPHDFRPPESWLTAWRRRYPQLEHKYVLTLPGRLTRLKGHEDFIDLMGQLKARGLAVHGLIVGGADPKRRRYAEEILGKVEDAGLTDTITFTGHRNDLREIMAISDAVLSLSSKPESFGRTTLEALSLGVPVIGYDHGGVGEQLATLLPEGRVPPGDMDALAALAVEWIQEPPQIPQNQMFTLQRMLDETLAIYDEIIA
jgi:glycosyltransferase involved in cell wall biosynthesis